MAYPQIAGVEDDFEGFKKKFKKLRKLAKPPGFKMARKLARRTMPRGVRRFAARTLPPGARRFARRSRMFGENAEIVNVERFGDYEVYTIGEVDEFGKFKFKKIIKKVGKLAKKLAPIALAVVGTALMPGVGTVLGKAAGAVMGGLKFVGGKLFSAPKPVMDAMTSRGIDPATATPEQVVAVAREVGAVTASTPVQTTAAPAGAIPEQVVEAGIMAAPRVGGLPSWVLPAAGGLAAVAIALSQRRPERGR